jgi:hypothetical protein
MAQQNIDGITENTIIEEDSQFVNFITKDGKSVRFPVRAGASREEIKEIYNRKYAPQAVSDDSPVTRKQSSIIDDIIGGTRSLGQGVLETGGMFLDPFIESIGRGISKITGTEYDPVTLSDLGEKIGRGGDSTADKFIRGASGVVLPGIGLGSSLGLKLIKPTTQTGKALKKTFTEDVIPSSVVAGTIPAAQDVVTAVGGDDLDKGIFGTGLGLTLGALTKRGLRSTGLDYPSVTPPPTIKGGLDDVTTQMQDARDASRQNFNKLDKDIVKIEIPASKIRDRLVAQKNKLIAGTTEETVEKINSRMSNIIDNYIKALDKKGNLNYRELKALNRTLQDEVSEAARKGTYTKDVGDVVDDIKQLMLDDSLIPEDYIVTHQTAKKAYQEENFYNDIKDTLEIAIKRSENSNKNVNELLKDELLKFFGGTGKRDTSAIKKRRRFLTNEQEQIIDNIIDSKDGALQKLLGLVGRLDPRRMSGRGLAATGTLLTAPETFQEGGTTAVTLLSGGLLANALKNRLAEQQFAKNIQSLLPIEEIINEPSLLGITAPIAGQTSLRAPSMTIDVIGERDDED